MSHATCHMPRTSYLFLLFLVWHSQGSKAHKDLLVGVKFLLKEDAHNYRYVPPLCLPWCVNQHGQHLCVCTSMCARNSVSASSATVNTV